MNTIQNASVKLALRFVLLAIVVTGVLAFISVLAGCTPVDRAQMRDALQVTPDSQTSTVEEEPVEEAPIADPQVVSFGSVYEYADGVSMIVEAPQLFEPTDSAAGVVKGQENLMFRVTIQNNSTDTLEPMVYSTLSSGGSEASSIFDVGNEETGPISGGPMTPILSGKSISWVEAYSVADAQDLTFQTSPSFEYENALFAQ